MVAAALGKRELERAGSPERNEQKHVATST
jgi:hypothetical protein